MCDSEYTTRTVALKLDLNQADVAAVCDTVEQVKALYKYVVTKCNEKQCVSYYTMAVPELYAEYRGKFPSIPSMLVQQTIKEACTNTRKWNDKHKKAKWTYQGIRTANSYPLNKRTLSIRGGLITFSTTKTRVRILAKLPDWFVERYKVSPNDMQAGTLKITPTGIRINLQYRFKKAELNKGAVIGIDRGLYNLCTLSDGTVISSKQAVAVKRRFQYLRSKLQQKGTQSAKRHLKKLSGREKRFMSDFNHCVTKQLASRKDVSTYVLEDLRGIRKKRKGRKLNSWLSNWSYYQFEQQLQYKCDLVGIAVAFIDPRYTSQKCSCCGTIDKHARDKSRYSCSVCGHKEHADINAAKNIRDNYARHRSEQGASTTQS